MSDSVPYTVAVIADIHGNAVALNAVLEDLKRRPYDCLVVAGDLVLNGPRPSECLDTIRNLGAPPLRVLWRVVGPKDPSSQIQTNHVESKSQ